MEETTRICVKNVPPNFTEAKLRSHLCSNSDKSLSVTDCRILRTEQGKSRKLAFVGFKNAEMARYAVSYFDKSFAATSRLSVEPAFSKLKNNDYRPWSKHSQGSSRYDALHKTEGSTKSPSSLKKSKREDNAEVDKKKQEFIDVMMGRKKNSSNSFWANDDGNGDKLNELDPKSPPEFRDKHKNDEESGSESKSSVSDSDNDSVDVMNSFKSNVSDMDFLRSKVLTEKENLSDNDDEESVDAEGVMDESQSSSAPSSSESDGSDSDNDRETGKISKNDSDENWKDNENKNGNRNALKARGAHTKPDPHENKSSLNLARLFVRNLPFSTTEEEILEAFSPYGDIIECHIPVDDTNKNKGYAFVKFSSHSEALSAMENLDGTPFQGRLVHILSAKVENNRTSDQHEGINVDMTHKMKKEIDRQKGATEDSTGWNASFVRGDAVVDNLASRLGIEKGSILDVKDGLSSGNAAVRLALGETQVLEENKKYFESHGVDISALGNKGAQRSSNILLVKNLPFDTSIDELKKVVNAAGGKAPKVLLPPSRSIALLIYERNNDAKKAFRKLAYKRFKHVPIYLEWAPLKVVQEQSYDVTNAPDMKNKSSINIGKGTEDDDEEAINDGEPTTVYVKNLNFRITEAKLLSVFEEAVDGVRSVRIPTKVASIKSSQVANAKEKSIRQSLGYGFIEFQSLEAAKKAISLLQGKVIDGHDIDIKISKQDNLTNTKVPGGKKKPSTKLIVRNVPFQASRSEILQLFGSFGQLKTVRLPKKFDGGHRGFAFVEFTGIKEALNAMNALSSTHLYGRHLVLEWADDKGDIGTLRSKAKRDSTTVSISKNKKIRF